MTVRDLFKVGMSRVETISTRTALNPLLWLLGYSLPLLLGAAVLVSDRLVQLCLIAMAGGSIFLTFVAYLVTLLREPDRLQSEEFRLRQSAIQAVSEAGDTSEIVEIVTQLPRPKIDRAKGGRR